MNTAAGLCRVTVVAPRTQIDLALPSDVTVADLLPTLLHFAGEDTVRPGRSVGRDGWVLQRLGGPPLDTASTPGQLQVLDGEQLFLNPCSAPAPEAVFDDVVDALAETVRGRADPWDSVTTRFFSRVFGAVTGVLAVVTLLLAGPPHLFGALAGLGLALLAVLLAAACSRAFGDPVTGAVLAAVAIVQAFGGGTLLFAGDRPLTALGAQQALVGAAVALLVTVLAAAGTGTHLPGYLAAAVTVLMLGLALLGATTGVSLAAAAAVAAAVLLALAPLLPALAYRLAGLPAPVIPSGADDLGADDDLVLDTAVLRRSKAADDYHSALLWATAIVVGIAEIALATAATVATWTTAAAIAITLLLRARILRGTLQRLPILISGLGGLAVVAVTASAAGSPLPAVLGVAVPVAVIGLAGLAAGLVLPGRRMSPVGGRTLDILEVVTMLAVVPLVLWVLGLYELVQGLGS